MNYDYSLYLVTDRNVLGGRSLEKAVEEAILGGCTMVQLREKETASGDFYHLAVAVKRVTDRYGIPLIINDRADIALAAGAAGVHLGQRDVPARAVRQIIGESMLLGVSAASLREAKQAERDGADYLGVGAVFPTMTKKEAGYVPLSELRKILGAVSVPVVAIGGVNRENAAELAALGVDGLAVVSAVLSQPDIRRAAEELRVIFGA